MSFLTPPPEFNECADATVLLHDKSCLPDMFYPSPTSSAHSALRQSSYPPASPSSQQESVFLEHEEEQHGLFENFDAPNSSTTAPASYSMDVPYAVYDQTAWSSFPGMPAQYPPLTHAPEEHGFFPSYNSTNQQIPPNMIPATPQPVSTTYSFGGPLATSYVQTISARQAFTPDASSMSSRSCSPNPSHFSVTNAHLHRRSSSRSNSTASANSPLSHYGIPVRAPGSSPNAAPQAWRCAYPNCTSRATFIRGCDLRKHYNRHSKHLFCRVDGCPQSEAAAMAAAQAADPHCKDSSQLVLSGGFSSKKDRARHEAKHNPGIKCEWVGSDGEGCGRVFSRMDNMKDHVRRIHLKGQPPGADASRVNRLKRR